MEIFWQVVATFVLFGVVGTLYVEGVHRAAALAVKYSPRWLARILSKPLWRTEYDRARPVNYIGLQAEDKLNKRSVR